jgi:tetratricopeptide (TPR) repeat protein
MKRFWIYLLALGAVLAPAAARAVTLDDAHAAFAAGKYHESTTDYEAVVAQQGYSVPVLFDLGNSYYREGNFSQAILAYKRALWLAPNDEDVRANLQAAQRQAGATVEKEPTYVKVAGVLGANGWAWVGCIAWTVLCASLLLRALLPARRGWFSAAGWACALVLVGAVVAIILSSSELREAVVVDKNPAALISPFPAAGPSALTPLPGETVRIEKAYNDYLLVADATGRSGWMAKSQLAPVVR